MGDDQLTLMYLPMRARAEALRMILLHANIPFHDQIITMAEWPSLKPSIPPGPIGSEFPGRPKGNRGVPVLKFANGEMLQESRDIAHHIATKAGSPLLPSDATLAAEAKDMFDKSQALPGFWPTALLIRFEEPISEKIMNGEDLGDAKFTDPDATLMQEWYAGQPKWSDTRDTLLSLEKILEGRTGAFFGGDQPHYGELGIFCQVDALVTLFGQESALAGFGAKFHTWYDSVCALPAISKYRSNRPVPGGPAQLGNPNTIIMNHTNPADRPNAKETAAKFWSQ